MGRRQAVHGAIRNRVAPAEGEAVGDQNRRYWALLREVAATVWVGRQQFSDEVWHEHFKRKFVGREEITLPSGEVETRGHIHDDAQRFRRHGYVMDEIALVRGAGFPIQEAGMTNPVINWQRLMLYLGDRLESVARRRIEDAQRQGRLDYA